MPGFHHILFPVDFSEPCHAIYPFVKTMAGRFGAKITLLHAVHIPPGVYGSFAVTYPVVVDINTLQQDAERQLAAFADTNDEEITTICPIGEPARAILEHVENHGVDLIMMPTHGYGPFRSLLLGSLTAKVLHDVSVPVWTAAHTTDPQLPTHVKCRSIVVAADLNKEAVCVVKRAVQLAELFDAKLHLVHAVPAATPHADSHMDSDYRHFVLEGARVEVAKLQQRAGSELPVTVEADTVSKLVQKVATQREADLVVIGRGKLHATFGRLRTHAYAIIRDSPCPVLSL
jgi:nucleotide-binding universal stress UspA family protein